MNFRDKEECFLHILFMVLKVNNKLFVLLLFVCFFFSLFFSWLRCMCSSINIENSAKLWKVHPYFDPSKSVLVLRNDLE